MELKQTDDFPLIGRILGACEGWNGVEVPHLAGVVWLLAISAGRPAGVLMVERKNPWEIRAHICMRSDFRGVGSYRTGIALLEWFANHSDKQLHKLTVEIPEHDESCLKLARAVGFKDEGFNRESVFREGKFEGQHVLGITREEAA